MRDRNKLLNEANVAYRVKNYEKALELYSLLIQQHPELKNILDFNLKLTLSKISVRLNQCGGDGVESDINKIKNSGLFDEEYYVNTNNLSLKEDAIQHFCSVGWKDNLNPSEHFSMLGYILSYPVVLSDGVNPLIHYLENISSKCNLMVSTHSILPTITDMTEFNDEIYLDMNPDVKGAGVNPRWHFVANGYAEGRCFKRNVKLANLDGYYNMLNEQNRKTYQDEFVKYEDHESLTNNLKLIAFYLTQYHPIPENDTAWGVGFTEWTNVSKALPQFEAHYQPRLPGELGYYDLRMPDIMKRQSELAKNYGISGFCFHYYWFDGERLLEKPLDIFLNSCDINIGFCINWANENWSKRWDGRESDVIKAQKFGENWEFNFIKDVAPMFNDKRYIRINNKPLLMLYRVDIIPNYQNLAEKWRAWCRDNGYGEIYLVITHSFGCVDPSKIGFDAAVEFAPNNFPVKKITDDMSFFNAEHNNIVYDYDDLVNLSLYKKAPAYKLFKSLCPSWDNEARKPAAGAIFHGASPAKYNNWLRGLIRYTEKELDKSEQVIFVNAWNEWGEGAYLEPDRKYGYAYLQNTYEALFDTNAKKLILVGHDAHFNGAQILLLNLAKSLKNIFNFNLVIFLKSGGQLVNEYQEYAEVIISENNVKSYMKLFGNDSYFSYALCNSAASGEIIEILKLSGISIVSLIHELPFAIERYGIMESAKLTARHADKLIFPSNMVKNNFVELFACEEQELLVNPQGLYQDNKFKDSIDDARIKLRSHLKLHAHVQIVLGCGYGDYRKGVDLFCETANLLINDENIKFVWLSNLAPEFKHYNDKYNNVIFVPTSNDSVFVSMFFAGADLFFMSSREDPFPSVVLESLNVGVPFIAFHGCGGFCDLVEKFNVGVLVPAFELDECARSISNLLNNREIYGDMSKLAKVSISENYRFKDYIYYLVSQLGIEYKKISVVVPNYNYASYIMQRLQSIIDQTYPIYEILILDDKSSDNSIELIKSFIEQNKQYDIKLIVNEVNSGSVFKQWYKGIEAASGEYIWIAEADDLANDNFLENIMSGINKYDNVVLGYCQSNQIDEYDTMLSGNYLDYVKDVSESKWRESYFNNGDDEIMVGLSVKNTIPNVSATVFKKSAVKDILPELLNYKIAGDWLFYISLLESGNIYFCHDSLNSHRRHSNSVTRIGFGQVIYDEIVKVQKFVKLNYSLSNTTLSKINSYNQELSKQFNLIIDVIE